MTIARSQLIDVSVTRWYRADCRPFDLKVGWNGGVPLRLRGDNALSRHAHDPVLESRCHPTGAICQARPVR